MLQYLIQLVILLFYLTRRVRQLVWFLKRQSIFSVIHTGHKDLTIRPKIDPFGNRKIGSAVMTPVDTLLYGNFWKEKKNSVLIAVNEIMNFALATRYTHLLNRKAAIGVHLSIYTSSIMQGAISKENYNGFKLSAYYQYYLINNLKGGIYLEPKLSIGYLMRIISPIMEVKMKLYTILTIIWLLVREHQLDFCSI